MIELIIEQNKAFNNCIKRGLPLDTESMVEHLKSEVVEFERSPRMNHKDSLQELLHIEDDKQFLLQHRLTMKDTKEGEAGDIMCNLMSLCELLSIELELVVKITQRANKLRND